MKRHVLIVARADVAVAIRSSVTAFIGKPASWLAATQLRRSTDAAGTVSHYAAHGFVSDTLWPQLLSILQDETDGVRDSVQWQGNGDDPVVPIADARWAIAYDGADIVAAYRLSSSDDGSLENPLDQLTLAGFVLTATDDQDGI